MKMQDVQRYQSEQLNDLEEEERRKNEELRLKAFEQIEEQEDEIKRLNEVSCLLHKYHISAFTINVIGNWMQKCHNMWSELLIIVCITHQVAALAF